LVKPLANKKRPSTPFTLAMINTKSSKTKSILVYPLSGASTLIFVKISDRLQLRKNRKKTGRMRYLNY